LEQLITNVERASDRKFTNEERNQLITIKFADDTRRGHSAIFVATGVSVDDYYERISKIIQHTDDLADVNSSNSLPAHLQRSVAPTPSTGTVLVEPPAHTYMTLRSLQGQQRQGKEGLEQEQDTAYRCSSSLHGYLQETQSCRWTCTGSNFQVQPGRI
jgi:hypothetical protein